MPEDNDNPVSSLVEQNPAIGHFPVPVQQDIAGLVKRMPKGESQILLKNLDVMSKAKPYEITSLLDKLKADYPESKQAAGTKPIESSVLPSVPGGVGHQAAGFAKETGSQLLETATGLPKFLATSVQMESPDLVKSFEQQLHRPSTAGKIAGTVGTAIGSAVNEAEANYHRGEYGRASADLLTGPLLAFVTGKIFGPEGEARSVDNLAAVADTTPDMARQAKPVIKVAAERLGYTEKSQFKVRQPLARFSTKDLRAEGVKRIGEIGTKARELAHEPVKQIMAKIGKYRNMQLRSQILNDIIQHAQDVERQQPDLSRRLYATAKLFSKQQSVADIYEMAKVAQKRVQALSGKSTGARIAASVQAIESWRFLNETIRKHLYPAMNKMMTNVTGKVTDVKPHMEQEHAVIQWADGVEKNVPRTLREQAKVSAEGVLGGGSDPYVRIGRGGGGLYERMRARMTTPAGQMTGKYRKGTMKPSLARRGAMPAAFALQDAIRAGTVTDQSARDEVEDMLKEMEADYSPDQ